MKIGVVCEGISDYRVLKHITERFLRDLDVYTIPLKPKITSQDKQDGFGSWQGVLEYLTGADGMLTEAVKEGCDYAIVQIDTDVREQYGVDQIIPEALHEAVMEMLLNRLHPDFISEKLIFAITIHETECWLISFLTDNKKDCCRIDGCVNKVNTLLKDKGHINKDQKNTLSAQRAYNYILSKKKKARELREISYSNYGFRFFIDSLDRTKSLHTD